MSNDVEIDTRKLDALIAAFKNSAPTAKVGVLGGGVRADDPSGRVKADHSFSEKSLKKKDLKGAEFKTNAEIGALHEFGGTKTPRRSWLRVPLSDHLQKWMEQHGAFTEESIQRIMKEKSLVPFMRVAGTVAVKVILEAFSTGGFGKWAKWKKGYSSKTGLILVDTQQLRNSVTFEVKK